MRRAKGSRPARRLRISIDALPRATKLAMLEGIRETPIIVGAYTSAEGTCPMLAAHRRGGRTSLGTFADAWDGYTRAMRRPRPATKRELRTLESMLEASLAEEESREGELSRAIEDHRETRERRRADGETSESRAPSASGRSAPVDTDRSRELRSRPGWAWLRVFRRLDDYQAALEQAQRQDAAGTGGSEAGSSPADGSEAEPAVPLSSGTER